MIDNVIVCLGAVFLIVIFVKARKTIREIETSRKNIENIFLHFSNKR
jgi:hypothetical protein